MLKLIKLSCTQPNTLRSFLFSLFKMKALTASSLFTIVFVLGEEQKFAFVA